MSSAVEQLAELFSFTLPGIDWEVLSESMKMTPVQIVLDETPTTDGKTTVGADAYQRPMLDAWADAQAAVDTIDLPWDIGTSESRRAWDAAQSQTVSVGDIALAGFRESFDAVLPASMSMDLNVEDFRAIVATTYMTAMYGAILHTRRALQATGTSADVIIDHATEVTQAFQLISSWNKHGVLDALKKTTSGTSGAPLVVAGALVLVATAVIAAIAWTIVANRRISETNRVMKSICDRATETGDQQLLKTCVALSEQNQVAVQSGPSSFGPNAILKWLAVAVGVYATMVVLPPLVRSMEAKSRRRLVREYNR